MGDGTFDYNVTPGPFSILYRFFPDTTLASDVGCRVSGVRCRVSGDT